MPCLSIVNLYMMSVTRGKYQAEICSTVVLDFSCSINGTIVEIFYEFLTEESRMV